MHRATGSDEHSAYGTHTMNDEQYVEASRAFAERC